MTHICVSNLAMIGSDNGLSSGRRQAIIWTNAGMLLIGPLGTTFSEILIKIYMLSLKKCIWKYRLEMAAMLSRPQWVKRMCILLTTPGYINILRLRQNERHFQVHFFLNEKVWIPMKISLKFVFKGPINNITALVQTMAWHRTGNKPLSEPIMVSLQMHICITWPQWVKLGKSWHFLKDFW